MRRLGHNLSALDATEPYDACVIGAGIAGSVIALRLEQAGLRVLLLESGGSPRHWMLDGRLRGLAALQVRGDAGYPEEAQTPRAVGGGSHVWSGVCERFEPGDFRAHAYLPQDNPWPLTYADLERHYTRAERLFRVRGGSRGTPRERPLPRLPTRRADTAFLNLVERSGVTVRPGALATASRDARVFDVRRELLPEFLATRGGTLVSGVTATRLRADRNGRIVGATCRTLDGGKKFARANTFIVCCGTVQTPRLLLLSRSPRFPFGIGNDYDRVGRGFSDQAVLTMSADAPRRALLQRPRAAYAHQCHRAFRQNGLGAIYPVFSASPRILAPPAAQGEHRLTRWLKTLRAPLDATLTVACRIETKPIEGNRVTLSSDLADPLGDPAAQLTFDYSAEDFTLIAQARALMHRWLDGCGAVRHVDQGVTWAGAPAGTCRMGTDPRTSVCDSTLRVHSTPNLYLCGAETFPIGGALPPVLTIAALADRLADHVIARTRWCGRATASSRTRRGMPSEPAPTVALVRREPLS
jgi:glucose dehydrogenase